MKVLHVTPAYYPATYWGGPIHSVHALNESLARLGLEVRVLTTDAAGPGRRERLAVDPRSPLVISPGHSVYYRRRIAGKEISVEMLASLFSLVRWADIVHLTATYSFPTIPTLLACRCLRKPLVWSPRGALLATHEWPGARNVRLKRLWEIVCSALARRRASALHVTSEAERVASLSRVPLAEARVVRNGVDVPTELPPRAWTPQGCLRLLFLGRLDPKKGIENLFHAVARLHDVRLKLNVFGAGEPSYVARLAELGSTLGISGRVHFRGHVDGDDKTLAFAQSDLCVAPSHSENFGMVIAEALAHGVPVIASTGTPWATVAERGCGEWIGNSPEELERGIRRMRERPLEDMGRHGRAWMLEEFSWDAVANEMRSFYCELLSNPLHGRN